MKNKKGFTLIELLAIIVILAIIAVITVPIILNIIENSKMGAATDSAYGFKDAVNKAYVTKLSGDSDYSIADDTYTVEDLKTQIGLSLSGKEPGSNSWVTIEKNNVTEGCLQYDEFKVEFTDGKVSNTEKGECSGLVFDNEILNNIASYFSNDIDRTVYFNPISGQLNCSDYHSDNSKSGFNGIITGDNSTKTTNNQTSCLKWYKYSINKDGTVNMILDHNTVNGVYWNNDGTTEYGIGSNTYGPVNLMQYLTLSEWNGVPTRTDKYTAYAKQSDETLTEQFTDIEGHSLSYSGKKARLIIAQEVADIVGKTWDERESSDFSGGLCFYNDGPIWNCSNDEQYAWLTENLDDDGGNMYWSSSPKINNEWNGNAWRISVNSIYAYMDEVGVYSTYIFAGVRPVISISIN